MRILNHKIHTYLTINENNIVIHNNSLIRNENNLMIHKNYHKK